MKVVFAGLAVKLPVGERVSQLLLVQLCLETWAVALVFADAVTVSVFESGADPPATALKVNVAGLNVSVAVAAVTVRVIWKVSDPWLESTTRVLVYVPAVRLVGVTEIVRTDGVVLVLRENDTQVALSLIRVKDTGVGLEMS